jgi:polygalacturonase
MHNNNGINIDSSDDVQIRNCDVNSRDDALAIKATSAAKPSRNIVASDCKLSSRSKYYGDAVTGARRAVRSLGS